MPNFEIGLWIVFRINLCWHISRNNIINLNKWWIQCNLYRAAMSNLVFPAWHHFGSKSIQNWLMSWIMTPLVDTDACRFFLRFWQSGGSWKPSILLLLRYEVLLRLALFSLRTNAIINLAATLQWPFWYYLDMMAVCIRLASMSEAYQTALWNLTPCTNENNSDELLLSVLVHYQIDKYKLSNDPTVRNYRCEQFSNRTSNALFQQRSPIS